MDVPSLDQVRAQAQEVPSFRGPLAFCSNMTPARVFGFPTAEHAYVASKTTDQAIRQRIKNTRADQAHLVKCWGNPRHKLCIITPDKLRPEWQDADFRLMVMEKILEQKFGPQNPYLVDLLLATENVPLVERVPWHDPFWGRCYCRRCEGRDGADHLGRLLRERRSALASPYSKGST